MFLTSVQHQLASLSISEIMAGGQTFPLFSLTTTEDQLSPLSFSFVYGGLASCCAFVIHRMLARASVYMTLQYTILLSYLYHTFLGYFIAFEIVEQVVLVLL